MITGDVPNLAEHLDVNTIRVHAPSKVILVCGGAYDAKDNDYGVKLPPRSLRDSFLRISYNSPFSKFRAVIPDEIRFSPPLGPYDELLEFETDLAQVSELVLLFSESAGSLAELGAFSVVDEIAKRLLVVIDDKNFNGTSFVRLGPIYTLLKHRGDASVFVLNIGDVNVERIKIGQEEDVRNINLDALGEALGPAFRSRLEAVITPSTFDATRSGHLIKLITGILQHYGAMKFGEIVTFLEGMGVPLEVERLQRLLFCAETVGWIKEVRRGIARFYGASVEHAAFSFNVKEGSPNLSRRTWKLQVREHWRENDPDRFRSIADAALAGGVRW